MDELKKLYEENKSFLKTVAVVSIIIAAAIWGQAPDV